VNSRFGLIFTRGIPRRPSALDLGDWTIWPDAIITRNDDEQTADVVYQVRYGMNGDKLRFAVAPVQVGRDKVNLTVRPEIIPAAVRRYGNYSIRTTLENGDVVVVPYL
jgi:hypothetical protein